MKWFTVVVLLTAAGLWRSAANSPLTQFLLGFVVCLGASLVAVQAAKANKYLWTGGFVVIAVLFNPLAPVIPFGGELGRWLALLSAVPFAVSLMTLRSQPLLSMASITDGNPRSRSL